MKKNNKQKHKRHVRKFRLTIMNENTLDMFFTMRLTKTKMWVYSLSVLAIVCILFYIVLFATPIKHILPGYLDPKMKQQMLTDAFRLEELSEKIDRQEVYMDVVKSLMSGQYEMDTTINLDSLAEQHAVVLKDASEVEKTYRQAYEEKEKYNLTAFEPRVDTEGWLFYMPVNGKLARAYNSDEKHFGIDLATTSSRQAVMSVLDGRIILATYTPDFDYIVMVQHNNDFVSVYQQMTEVLKSVGDEVKAGEPIAFIGKSRDKSNPHLHFELWHKGRPLNPEEYILFK